MIVVTAMFRYRSGAISVPMAALLAKTTPIPSPDIMRKSIISSTDCGISPVTIMDEPIKNVANKRILRRPTLSANGTINIAPNVMPTSAALKIYPFCAGVIPHSWVRDGAATDIATTSTPSTKFRKNPMRTTNI